MCSVREFYSIRCLTEDEFGYPMPTRADGTTLTAESGAGTRASPFVFELTDADGIVTVETPQYPDCEYFPDTIYHYRFRVQQTNPLTQRLSSSDNLS